MNPQLVLEWFFAALSGNSALTALVGARKYPDAAPANTTNPALVYQVIDAPPEDVLDPGAVTQGEVAIQLRCYGNTRKSANQVREILRQQFQNLPPVDAEDQSLRITGSRFADLTETFDRSTEDYGSLAILTLGIEEL